MVVCSVTWPAGILDHRSMVWLHLKSVLSMVCPIIGLKRLITTHCFVMRLDDMIVYPPEMIVHTYFQLCKFEHTRVPSLSMDILCWKGGGPIPGILPYPTTLKFDHLNIQFVVSNRSKIYKLCAFLLHHCNLQPDEGLCHLITEHISLFLIQLKYFLMWENGKLATMPPQTTETHF